VKTVDTKQNQIGSEWLPLNKWRVGTRSWCEFSSYFASSACKSVKTLCI